jgi:FkbM family methyltransferase
MVQALKAFPRLASFIRQARGQILHKPELNVPSETIGSVYASHTIPSGSIDQNSVVYSFGIGTDASFDLGVIDKYGCFVHGFDPTPRSIDWVGKNVFQEKFVFHPYGIAERDGNVGFQSPSKQSHVSFYRSINTEHGVVLPVRRLKTIMQDLNHSQIDVLKLDIEGFEYATLRDILGANIFPRYIAVEFHHRMYAITDAETYSAVKRLQNAGYALFHVSNTGREYSFLRKD